MMEIGITGKQSEKVILTNSAASVGSGLLEVYATPAMIALMEKTASESVAPYLDCGCGTVGTHIDVAHTSATPIGLTVTCETKLTAIDGRRLTFEVRAFDDAGEIGHGTHERFIVQNEKFMAKTALKSRDSLK